MKNYFKVLSVIFIIGFLIVSVNGCKKDSKDDGPNLISVQTTINPTTIASGATAQYTIVISNLTANPIDVTRIHMKDEFVSGWATGQPDQEADLSTTTISFAAYETITVFDQTIGPVYNTGSNDVGVRNTVTAYYAGGSESDVVNYTLLNAKKKSGVNRVNALANNPIIETIE